MKRKSPNITPEERDRNKRQKEHTREKQEYYKKNPPLFPQSFIDAGKEWALEYEQTQQEAKSLFEIINRNVMEFEALPPIKADVVVELISLLDKQNNDNHKAQKVASKVIKERAAKKHDDIAKAVDDLLIHPDTCGWSNSQIFTFIKKKGTDYSDRVLKSMVYERIKEHRK